MAESECFASVRAAYPVPRQVFDTLARQARFQPRNALHEARWHHFVLQHNHSYQSPPLGDGPHAVLTLRMPISTAVSTRNSSGLMYFRILASNFTMLAQ